MTSGHSVRPWSVTNRQVHRRVHPQFQLTSFLSRFTLRPPSPPLPSSSSHSGPLSSHLSLHNPAPSTSSSVGSDTLATQRQEIREAWIDAEGEIPVSWSQ